MNWSPSPFEEKKKRMTGLLETAKLLNVERVLLETQYDETLWISTVAEN